MKGICISERFNLMDRLLDRLSGLYGIHLQMVEVTGRRWSHVAGSFDEDPSPVPPARISIDGRYCLFAGGWDGLPECSREEILGAIRKMLEEKADGEK
ncbi:MAG: hypothetical protein JW902_09315 [Syntrophaceae bacterium]|nr:hypothetical protein [Syntrophaceae bacterium]